MDCKCTEKGDILHQVDSISVGGRKRRPENEIGGEWGGEEEGEEGEEGGGEEGGGGGGGHGGEDGAGGERTEPGIEDPQFPL